MSRYRVSVYMVSGVNTSATYPNTPYPCPSTGMVSTPVIIPYEKKRGLINCAVIPVLVTHLTGFYHMFAVPHTF